MIAEVDRSNIFLADRNTMYLIIAPRILGDDYQCVCVDGVTKLLYAVIGTAVRRIIHTSWARESVMGLQAPGSVIRRGDVSPRLR